MSCGFLKINFYPAGAAGRMLCIKPVPPKKYGYRDQEARYQKLILQNRIYAVKVGGGKIKKIVRHKRLNT